MYEDKNERHHEALSSADFYRFYLFVYMSIYEATNKMHKKKRCINGIVAC